MTAQPIYLDYQSTTPIDPTVYETMNPFWDEKFGNPHSNDHNYGIEAARAVRLARAKVASLINADDDEIVFTSGATESCNLALRGVVANAPNGKRHRIVTVATEHPSVFETARQLSGPELETVVVPVGSSGHIDLGHLDTVLDERTLLVSIMAANNEIGTLHPISKVAKICRDVGALLHTDATQAAARIPVNVVEWDVDLLSISSHKMYGPKGAGALFIRRGVEIQPMITGGGQEMGRRSGTLATPIIVGFGAACSLARRCLVDDRKRLDRLTAHLHNGLKECCPNMILFGDADQRLPGNLNVGFPGISAIQIIQSLSGRVAVATGAACSSAYTSPSRVMLALGLDNEVAATALRVSLGRFTTESEIDAVVTIFSGILGGTNGHR